MRGLPVLILGCAAACGPPQAAPVRHATVNLRDTARSALTEPDAAPAHHGGIPDGTGAEFLDAIGDPDRLTPWRPRRGLRPFMPVEPTPDLIHSFEGLGDDNRSVPPDTMGAVGPDHLVVTLNTQLRVQSRAGEELSTVTLDAFWRDLGADAFDPRVFYDHFEDRWITVAVGDARTENSAVLLAVTQGADPTGDWLLHRYDADPADQTWADYPVLGFNHRWIAIQNNMFDFDGGFLRGDLWILDKADLYAGGDGDPRVIDVGHVGTLAPAVVFDADEDDLPCVVHWSGLMNGRGFIRLYRITGATDDPQLESVEFASVEQPWDFAPPGQADFAPQAGSAALLQNNDARIQAVVQREGSIWAVHTNFVPEGAPTRAAIRFWELGPDASVRQSGLIDGDDAGRHYAFPSLAVNASRDVLIGFSQFGADIFPSAAYAFRSNRDMAGEVREVLTLRAGQAPYEKSRAGRNRWGDYSATTVDPLDDQTLWTLQEYAAPPADGADRFGVWWGALTPPGSPPVWLGPGDLAVDEGQALDVALQAIDADGDALQYTGETLPAGAVLDAGADPPRLRWTPGFDQAGEHEVVLAVTDGGRIVRLRIDVTVRNVDRPPTLADPGDRQVRELQRLTVRLDGVDPDGDVVTFGVTPLPSGASLDPASGRFSWLPQPGDAGDYDVTFSVSAGGLQADRRATITVAGRNRPPVLDPLVDAAFDEGDHLSVAISGTDPDGDDVAILLTPMPIGAIYDDQGRFQWTSGFDQEGVYELRVTATDGALTDSALWQVVVRDVNRPPVFTPVGAQHLAEGEQMLFIAEAVDPDGDEVALSAESLPGAAQFDPQTGACMWDAGFEAAGEWMVMLGASDGEQRVVMRVPVTIEDVNRRPVLEPPDPALAAGAAEGRELVLPLAASDPDGDAVELTAVGLPDGARLDAAAGEITWTPGFDQAGRHPVTVRASDGDLADEALVIIEVSDTNRPPVILSPAADELLVAVDEGRPLTVELRADDPDGDLVLLSAEGLPPGARVSADAVLGWTPTHDDAGDHEVIVVASDGALQARTPLVIRVADVDRAPLLALIADQRAREGAELDVAIVASDPDGDELSLTLTAAPEGAALHADDLRLRWTPGFDQAGEHEIAIEASAAGARTEVRFTVTVADVDRPPTLEITGDPSSGREGEPFSLTLVGADPDGDEVRYAAGALPAGATVDSRSGALSWTPGFDQAGIHPVALLALAAGAVTRLDLELTVADVDRPPTLEITGPTGGREGEALELRLIAHDPDGASLTVTAPTLPRGAELDGWVIRWTPDFDQGGPAPRSHDVVAEVSDGVQRARAETSLAITNVNRPPTLAPAAALAAASVSEQELLRLDLAPAAADPDGDALTYRITGLPPAATLHRTLGTLTWTPTYADAGQYPAELSVSDGALSAHAALQIEVRDVNRPPTIRAPGIHQADPGSALVITPVIADPDGDPLTVTAAPMPKGATITAETGELRWTPSAKAAGQHPLTLTASDGALTATTELTIFVSDSPDSGCAQSVQGAASPVGVTGPGIRWMAARR